MPSPEEMGLSPEDMNFEAPEEPQVVVEKKLEKSEDKSTIQRAVEEWAERTRKKLNVTDDSSAIEQIIKRAFGRGKNSDPESKS
ncbi:MAG: hypothetical protein HY092_01710 [Candidatus Kerfeldbacteria bacterium]|nr:hypothetical protein [Candidatus Kerfeldbacteria bacterium]